DADYVDVTPVKSAEAIEKIFTKRRVSSLEIEIRRPNASPRDSLRKIEKIMEEENARKWNERLIAVDGESIEKSDRIEDMMVASQRCGNIKATTYSEETGKKEEIDTKDH